jgi:hypothetical protein
MSMWYREAPPSLERAASLRKGRSVSCTIAHASPCQLHGGGDEDGPRHSPAGRGTWELGDR